MKKFIIVILALSSLNIDYASELDSVSRYKYISYDNIFIDNEKMDLRMLVDDCLFKGYMIFEITANSENDDSVYYNCQFYWVHSINDILDYSRHYDFVFPLHYSNYTQGNSVNNLDSLKLVYFEEFSNRYVQLFNEVNQQERDDKYFLWKMLKTDIFNNPNVLFYQRDINTLIGYYVFKCAFNSLLIEFTGYKFDDKLNKKLFKTLIPTSKILYWEPVAEQEMKYYGFGIGNWIPKGLYSKY